MRGKRGGDPRRTKLLRESGPYTVYSLSNGSVQIIPCWYQFPPYDPENGGGPGVVSRVALAKDIERLLNRGET